MKAVYGVIGHPIGHSMSPLIHNDAFRQNGIEAEYHAFDVHPDDVKEAMSGIRALQIKGCNVTVPHKLAVMDCLDEIDEEAKLIGAVNTIVNQNGRLIGYNTDGRGYVESLLEVTDTLSDKHILIIGAGGASRGIVTSMLREGIRRLSITNRSSEKVQPLLELANHFETDSEMVSKEEAEANCAEYDVIINTTSVGMSPNNDQIPFSVEKIKEGAIVSDLIYNPIETRLLKDAKALGAITHSGIGMFVNQAAIAFELWTRVKPDRAKMKELVVRQLGGKTC